jgi:hypothetical protein
MMIRAITISAPVLRKTPSARSIFNLLFSRPFVGELLQCFAEDFREPLLHNLLGDVALTESAQLNLLGAP